MTDQTETPMSAEEKFGRDLVARTTFEKEAVWLPSLAVHHMNAGKTFIEDKTFTNCLIEGPAVMAVMNGTTFDSCNMGAAANPRNLLLKPLGGALSQFRAGMSGVANSRASSWNRAPIDRMANLNIEPGDQPLNKLIEGIEHGILMSTNRSWSIDDARNKFQFGCEWGQLIENGELKGVVKNPNYRGVSAQFWKSLSAVGDANTFQVLGTPNCGKGEPNQVIRVGHASPACVFSNVDVFGGDA